MKAMQMTAIGSPDVLGLNNIPEPEAAPGQVKVRLRAAGVNPVDTKLRSTGLFFPDALPAILGCDGAGVVVETGSQVSYLSTGDESSRPEKLTDSLKPDTRGVSWYWFGNLRQ